MKCLLFLEKLLTNMKSQLMYLAFFIGIIFCFISFISYKTDFFEIYRDKETVIYKENTSSSSGWVKYHHFATKIKNSKGKIITKPSKDILEYWKCDCNTHSKYYSIEDYVVYDSKGKATSSGDRSIYRERPIPNSIGELIYESFCKGEIANYIDIDSAAITVDTLSSF